MDYTQARDRLRLPRAQKSKWIGHKLLLAWNDKLNDTWIFLSYYGKWILEWSEDGRIRIGLGNYLYSAMTVGKVNAHLPTGWRLELKNLRHQGRLRARTGIVTVRNNRELICSMPYGGHDAEYADHGRVDKGHQSSCYDPKEKNAEEYFNRVGEYVEEYVEALLRGELSWEDRELIDSIPLCVNKKIVSADLIQHLQHSRPEDSKLLDNIHLFWKENFPHTKKAKTHKEMARQLEHQMRTGIHGIRPRASSKRSELKFALETFILTESGFCVTYG